MGPLVRTYDCRFPKGLQSDRNGKEKTLVVSAQTSNEASVHAYNLNEENSA